VARACGSALIPGYFGVRGAADAAYWIGSKKLTENGA
jgi:hypothetical protein